MNYRPSISRSIVDNNASQWKESIAFLRSYSYVKIVRLLQIGPMHSWPASRYRTSVSTDNNNCFGASIYRGRSISSARICLSSLAVWHLIGHPIRSSNIVYRVIWILIKFDTCFFFSYVSFRSKEYTFPAFSNIWTTEGIANNLFLQRVFLTWRERASFNMRNHTARRFTFRRNNALLPGFWKRCSVRLRYRDSSKNLCDFQRSKEWFICKPTFTILSS